MRLVAQPIVNLGPEVTSVLPATTEHAVFEYVTLNQLYADGESPRLGYPQVFRYFIENTPPDSAEVQLELRRTKYSLLVGPSGGGRNTVIARLCELYPESYSQLLSMTTRPCRFDVVTGQWEQQDQSYMHRSVEVVLSEIALGNFFEWEVIHGQQVSGTHLDSLRRVQDGLIAINDTEPGGADKLYEVTGRPSIFLIPRPFDKWLQNRLAGMEVQEKHRRLSTAKANFELAKNQEKFAYLLYDLCDEEDRKRSIDESARKLHCILTAIHEGGINQYKSEFSEDVAIATDILDKYISKIDLLLKQTFIPDN